jgi:hypothetical protein
VPTTPTVVDGVVSLGTSLSSRIPGPVGAVATAALKSLGSTIDRILPIRAGPGALSLPKANPAGLLSLGKTNPAS